jgi:hypothetical protein
MQTVHPHRRLFGHRHHVQDRHGFVYAAPYAFTDTMHRAAWSRDEVAVPLGQPVVINGRPCFVQTHIVPSEESGDRRPVTVTRCY